MKIRNSDVLFGRFHCTINNREGRKAKYFVDTLLLQEFSIYCLKESVAALDAEAEYEFNKRVLEKVKDKIFYLLCID